MTTNKMRVGVFCESSGVVRNAFRKRGHDAWSIDILPADDNSPYHLQMDALLAVQLGWDLGIFHPPCTFLCNSGVRWLFADGRSNGQPLTFANRNEKRWQQMKDAEKFFNDCCNANIDKVCVENPISHGHCQLVPFTQYIQPWQFGHGETKKTGLVLKNLPKLQPTKIVTGRDPVVHHASPGPDRWKLRSKTYQGIADAFAEQWG